MEIGLFAPLANPFGTPQLARAIAEGAEARGFGSLWLAEHVVLFDSYGSAYPYADDGKIPAPPDAGILEPFTTLAFLAACTTTLRLGTAICLLPQRNPVYTAKEVANLDWLSGGRIDFGIGIGWSDEEYAAVDVPFARRGARCDEYLDVLRACWTDATPSYDGEIYRLPECRLDPKPVQSPLPITVGGESDAAMRRAARRAQGWFGFNHTPESAADSVERLRRIADGEERDPDELTVTICPYLTPFGADDVARYAAAGVDRIVALALAFAPGDVDATLDALVPVLDAARGV